MNYSTRKGLACWRFLARDILQNARMLSIVTPMVRHESEIESVEVKGEGISGVRKQILVGPNDGWQGYMRVFALEVGGNTPAHRHPWWHVNYVLEGEGTVFIDGVGHVVKAGSVAHIEGGKLHQFVNTGAVPLKFICLVPPEGDHY